MTRQVFGPIARLWARLKGQISSRADEQAPNLSLPPYEAGSNIPGAGADEDADRPIPYDGALLDRARTQWQFGDWESLAAITQQPLQHHPERAKLALMAAAGLQQLGRAEEAKTLTRQALDWGCSLRWMVHFLRQILNFGMQNSLARTNAILGQVYLQSHANICEPRSLSTGIAGRLLLRR